MARKLQRSYTNGRGEVVNVEITIRDEGDLFERELARLANKARLARHGKASGFGGVISVQVQGADVAR